MELKFACSITFLSYMISVANGQLGVNVTAVTASPANATSTPVVAPNVTTTSTTTTTTTTPPSVTTEAAAPVTTASPGAKSDEKSSGERSGKSSGERSGKSSGERSGKKSKKSRGKKSKSRGRDRGRSFSKSKGSKGKSKTTTTTTPPPESSSSESDEQGSAKGGKSSDSVEQLRKAALKFGRNGRTFNKDPNAEPKIQTSIIKSSKSSHTSSNSKSSTKSDNINTSDMGLPPFSASEEAKSSKPAVVAPKPRDSVEQVRQKPQKYPTSSPPKSNPKTVTPVSGNSTQLEKLELKLDMLLEEQQIMKAMLKKLEGKSDCQWNNKDSDFDMPPRPPKW